MYGNFGIFGEKAEEDKPKRKKHRKKKTKQIDDTQIGDALPSDVEGVADSDDEESMRAYVPKWAQVSPEQVLMGTMISSMEKSVQDLQVSQGELQQALGEVQKLKGNVAYIHNKLFKMEAMQKKDLTEEEYEEKYEVVSGGCCIS